MEGRQGIGGKMAQLLVSFRSQMDVKFAFQNPMRWYSRHTVILSQKPSQNLIFTPAVDLHITRTIDSFNA